MPSSARKKKVAVDAWHGGEDSDARALPSPTETVFSLALHTRHRDLHSFPTRRSSDLDRRNHHLFQPLLYQVATGILAPGQVAPPLRHVLRRDKNVTVELVDVTGFDLDRRVVRARRPLGVGEIEVPYDSLIVAAGVTQTYFGHDEF